MCANVKLRGRWKSLTAKWFAIKRMTSDSLESSNANQMNYLSNGMSFRWLLLFRSDQFSLLVNSLVVQLYGDAFQVGFCVFISLTVHKYGSIFCFSTVFVLWTLDSPSFVALIINWSNSTFCCLRISLETVRNVEMSNWRLVE